MPNGATAPPGSTTPPGSTAPPPVSIQTVFAGYGQMSDLGSNWRVKFYDADGIPLNMVSFDVIDFGAISFKEIFQNVKTILATPIFSAALERTLGLDQTIVDLPISDAAPQATIAILAALNAWEPRVQVINIDFEPDVLAGHLICTLQLQINNVIYGSDRPYDRNNIFGTPTVVQQDLPQIEFVEGPQGPPGPPGATGQRGSLWFSGTTSPPSGALAPMKIPVAGPPGSPGEAGKRGFIWLSGTGDPVTPQDKDMYLNAANGDVWQFDGLTKTWQRTGKR
jgi:Bacteriophage baseplate protein W